MVENSNIVICTKWIVDDILTLESCFLGYTQMLLLNQQLIVVVQSLSHLVPHIRLFYHAQHQARNLLLSDNRIRVPLLAFVLIRNKHWGLQAHLDDVSIGQTMWLSIYPRFANAVEEFFAVPVHRSYGYPNCALHFEVYESYGLESPLVFKYRQGLGF